MAGSVPIGFSVCEFRRLMVQQTCAMVRESSMIGKISLAQLWVKFS